MEQPPRSSRSPGTAAGEHSNVAEETLVVPVMRETLDVDVRPVESGRVRIHKSVETHEHPVRVALRRDEVHVQRVACNREVDAAAPPAMREENGVLIVPVLEERLVVRKVMVLKEELHITRTAHTHEEVHEVALREERVEIERVAAAPGAPSANSSDR